LQEKPQYECGSFANEFLNPSEKPLGFEGTFRYSGSLTTPPCSEGVSWFVMTSPIQLSADQIAAFESVHEGNNRPVQPLNTRTLSEDTTP
jgi:carbonic anhydrase